MRPSGELHGHKGVRNRFFCGSGAIVLCCLWMILPMGLHAAPLGAPPTIAARDAFGRDVVLNAPGYVTVVLSSTEKTQQATRGAADALDHFQRAPSFRLIVLVDLHDSLAAWMPGYVSHRMQEDLRREAARLQMLRAKDGRRSGWHPFVCAIPDFNGRTVRRLGWRGDGRRLKATIYDRSGLELARWNNLEPKEYGTVEAIVAHALDRKS